MVSITCNYVVQGACKSFGWKGCHCLLRCGACYYEKYVPFAVVWFPQKRGKKEWICSISHYYCIIGLLLIVALDFFFLVLFKLRWPFFTWSVQVIWPDPRSHYWPRNRDKNYSRSMANFSLIYDFFFWGVGYIYFHLTSPYFFFFKTFTKQVVEDFASENIVYLELRTTPKVFTCVLTSR